MTSILFYSILLMIGHVYRQRVISSFLLFSSKTLRQTRTLQQPCVTEFHSMPLFDFTKKKVVTRSLLKLESSFVLYHQQMFTSYFGRCSVLALPQSPALSSSESPTCHPTQASMTAVWAGEERKNVQAAAFSPPPEGDASLVTPSIRRLLM